MILRAMVITSTISGVLLLESCKEARLVEARSGKFVERILVFFLTAPVDTVLGVPCLLKGGMAAVGKF